MKGLLIGAAILTASAVLGFKDCEECLDRVHKLGDLLKGQGQDISDFLAENYCPGIEDENCADKVYERYPKMLEMIVEEFIEDGNQRICNDVGYCGEQSTQPPTTEAPTTEAPTTEAPTTEAPTTEAPTTEAPTTEAPTTEAPTTEAPTTEGPTTEAPTTEAPTTEAPTTEAPTTEAPTTEAPTTVMETTTVISRDVREMTCADCNMVFKDIKGLLTGNKHITEMEHYLERHYCKHDEHDVDCPDYVYTHFAPMHVMVMDEFMHPHKVCVYFEYCP